MKVELKKIVGAAEALKELNAAKMPVRAAVVAALLSKAVQPSLEVYNDTYNKTLAEYGVPIEGKPGNFSFTPEAQRKVEAVLAEALAVEVDIAVEPLPVSMLGDAAHLTPDTLFRLDWFITLA